MDTSTQMPHTLLKYKITHTKESSFSPNHGAWPSISPNILCGLTMASFTHVENMGLIPTSSTIYQSIPKCYWFFLLSFSGSGCLPPSTLTHSLDCSQPGPLPASPPQCGVSARPSWVATPMLHVASGVEGSWVWFTGSSSPSSPASSTALRYLQFPE